MNFSRNLMRLTERASNRLKALREAVSHTKQAYKKLVERMSNCDNPTEEKTLKDNIKSCRERIQNYRMEMQRTSLDRDQGYWDDRSALVSVLELWKAIKSLRNEQDYDNTSLKLSIVEIPVDYKEDKLAWQRAIEEEFNDLKDEYDENFEIEIHNYNQEMQKWMSDRHAAQKKRGRSLNNMNLSFT